MKKCTIIILSIIFLTSCTNNTIKPKESNVDVITKTTTNTPVVTEKSTPAIATEVIPEPYARSLDKFKEGDITMGEKYLSLTMSDFKTSKFADNALVLKTMLLASDIFSIKEILEDFTDGFKKSVLLEQDKLDYFDKKIDDLGKTSVEKHKELEKLMIAFFEKYPNSYDFGDTYYENKFTSIEVPFSTLVDSDVVNSQTYRKSKKFEAIMKESIVDNKLNIINYFFNIAQLTGSNKDLTMRMLNEIIKLTENNKYNEKRITVQEALENNK